MTVFATKEEFYLVATPGIGVYNKPALSNSSPRHDKQKSRRAGEGRIRAIPAPRLIPAHRTLAK